MAKNRHLSPREETERDTSVFMYVVIYTGIAFIVFFAAALLIVYGTNGKIIPRASEAHPTSQMNWVTPTPVRAASSYLS